MPSCDQCEGAVIPQFFYGLNYSVFMVLVWGCMSYLVPERSYSISQGIITCVMNFGCTILPVIFSSLHDSTPEWLHGWGSVTSLSIAVCAASLLLKIHIRNYDLRARGGVFESVDPFEKF